MKRRVSTALLIAMLAPIAMASTAAADDDTTAAPKQGATVGIRTATPDSGDDRGRYEFEIMPRGVFQDYVAVSNYQRRPITVRLMAKDATTVTDTPYAVQESSAIPTDVGAWIVLKRSHLTLPPRSETIVPFQVGVPANATPGDHNGAIIVSLLAREPKPDGGTVIVDHRVGLQVHLRVPGALKPQLTVSDLHATWNGPWSPTGRGDATITYTVRNTGNVRLGATTDISLSRTLGLPATHLAADPIEDILPGGEIKVSEAARGVFGAGPMDVDVTLNPTSLDTEVAKVMEPATASTSMSAYPWLLILIVMLTCVLIGLGIWRWRRTRGTSKGSHASGKPMRPSDSKVDNAAKAGDVLVRGRHRVARSAIPLIAAFGLCMLVTGVGAPAHASADKPDQWRATTSTKKGTASIAFDLKTSGGCPPPATNVVGYAYGKGLPKAGAVILGNTEAGVSQTGPFTVPVSDTMTNVMLQQPNPQLLDGTYRFVVQCEQVDPLKITGEYVVEIEFTDPTHWKASPPVTKETGPDMPGATTDTRPDEPQNAGPGKTKDDQQPTAGADGNANGSGGKASQKGAGDQAADLNGVQAAGDEAAGNSFSGPLALAAVIVLIGTAVGLYMTRRSRKGGDA